MVSPTQVLENGQLDQEQPHAAPLHARASQNSSTDPCIQSPLTHLVTAKLPDDTSA